MTGTDGIDPATAATRLRAALESMADALGRADIASLLAAEEVLEPALADCARLAASQRPPAAHAADALRAEVDAARRALMRCRRLGASLGDFARASFDARGIGIGYDPAQAAAATLNGRGFQTRG